MIRSDLLKFLPVSLLLLIPGSSLLLIPYFVYMPIPSQYMTEVAFGKRSEELNAKQGKAHGALISQLKQFLVKHEVTQQSFSELPQAR